MYFHLMAKRLNPVSNDMTFSYLTNLAKLFLTISMHSPNCSSVMTKGGVNLMVSPCVGLANKPLLAILNDNVRHFISPLFILHTFITVSLTSTQMSHASKPSETTIALNSPLPRTVLTTCDGSSDFSADLKYRVAYVALIRGDRFVFNYHANSLIDATMLVL